MAAAKSLADLMKIRALPRNRKYLDSINGNLGTALGFKRRTGEGLSEEPAIIVFVPEKIHRKWLPRSELIKERLSGPDGLSCPLDVVAGGKAAHEEPIPESGTALAQRLRGWDEKIWCGSQVSSMHGGNVAYGTLGAFVKRNSDGMLGFITNDHVAIGPTLWHPWAPGSPGFRAGTKLIGAKQESIIERPVTTWYGKFAEEPGNPTTAVRVDCAFVSTSLGEDDVQPKPLVEQPLKPGPFGSVFHVDLEAEMTDPAKGIIGRDVYHVGRTTGLRKGSIAAFSYEWKDQPGQTRYADFLIEGETMPLATGLEISVPFSYKGDSGSILFTQLNNERRPIALLWGGYQEQLRGGESQENWSYATRLDKVLDQLGVTLVTDAAEFR